MPNFFPNTPIFSTMNEVTGKPYLHNLSTEFVLIKNQVVLSFPLRLYAKNSIDRAFHNERFNYKLEKWNG